MPELVLKREGLLVDNLWMGVEQTSWPFWIAQWLLLPSAKIFFLTSFQDWKWEALFCNGSPFFPHSFSWWCWGQRAEPRALQWDIPQGLYLPPHGYSLLSTCMTSLKGPLKKSFLVHQLWLVYFLLELLLCALPGVAVTVEEHLEFMNDPDCNCRNSVQCPYVLLYQNPAQTPSFFPTAI